MPISFEPSLMRAIIMDHYQNPRNVRKILDGDHDYITVHMDSASCIDDIFVHVKLVGDRIDDIKWHSNDCCAISAASTSIMTELVLNKTVDEAASIMENFQLMLEEKDYDSDLLQEANCFKNTARQPSRIGCATIGWRGLFSAIKEKENERR